MFNLISINIYLIWKKISSQSVKNEQDMNLKSSKLERKINKAIELLDRSPDTPKEQHAQTHRFRCVLNVGTRFFVIIQYSTNPANPYQHLYLVDLRHEKMYFLNSEKNTLMRNHR